MGAYKKEMINAEYERINKLKIDPKAATDLELLYHVYQGEIRQFQNKTDFRLW